MSALAHEAPFQLGGLSVRPAELEIVDGARRESVEPRVMEVLVRLARAEGAVVSRDDLIEACWGGRVVSDDAVNRVIAKVRRIPEAFDGRGFTLETITKVGYRLRAVEGPVVGEAAPVAPPASAPAAVPEPAPATAAPRGPARAFLAGRLGLAAGAVATIAAVLAGVMVLRPPPPPAEQVTLAVAPFERAGPGEEVAFAAQSLSPEVRNRVARVRGLQVIGQTSVEALAQEDLSPQELGTRLEADLVLEGVVRLDGDKLRALVTLVDATSGAQIASLTAESGKDDFATLERALSDGVVEMLVSELGPDRISAPPPPRPVDPDARVRLLRANELLRQAFVAGAQGRIEEARDLAQAADTLLEEVFARDPNNADALVLRGHMVARAMSTEMASQRQTPSERRAEALRLFRRALGADPDNLNALISLGEAYRRYEWRWEDAERLFLRGLAIDPNNSDARGRYSYLLSTTGRCKEAQEQARIAARLDPFGYSVSVPRTLACDGADARTDYYAKELADRPGNIFMVREIYIDRLLERDVGGVRALIDTVRSRHPEGLPPAVAQEVARLEAGADALEGRPDRLLALVDQDAAAYAALDPYSPATVNNRWSNDLLYTLAVEAAMAGDTDKAIDLLGRALAGGSVYMPQTLPGGSHEFTPEMRADPRYQALWRSDPRLARLVELRAKNLKD